MNMVYSGVGARVTPPEYLQWMTRIANYLDLKGYTLRSGNADGADKAFQSGTDNLEVHLPWPTYNGGHKKAVHQTRDKVADTFEILFDIEPNSRYFTTTVLSLHGRNVAILLGSELYLPSDFMLYWNPPKKKKGGTHMALRIAKYFNIPTYNLAVEKEVEEFKEDFDFEDLPFKEFDSDDTTSIIPWQWENRNS